MLNWGERTPIDKKGIVWGLLLAVVATGLYDMMKALLEGDYKAETIALAATLIVVVVLFLAFRKLLLEPSETQIRRG